MQAANIRLVVAAQMHCIAGTLSCRNDAEATLSTAPKFAEPWRYRGREYCFALVAVRPERRTIHYLPQGISEHSVVEHCGAKINKLSFSSA